MAYVIVTTEGSDEQTRHNWPGMTADHVLAIYRAQHLRAIWDGDALTVTRHHHRYGCDDRHPCPVVEQRLTFHDEQEAAA